MNDFIKEGVKVGDRLYSLIHGWGEVVSISSETQPRYPIWVRFDEHLEYSYTKEGLYEKSHIRPTLLWDEPKFEIPVKPKREVIKEFDVYVNYDPMQPYQTESFCSEARADYHCSESDIRVKGKLTFTILE